MGSTYFIVLILAYTLAAYYVLPTQSIIDRPALTARRCISYLFCLLVLFSASTLTSSCSAVWLNIAGAGAFIAIDVFQVFLSWMMKRKHRLTPEAQRKLFFVTNLLWIFALILLGYTNTLIHHEPVMSQSLELLWRRAGIDRFAVLKWGTALLLIHKPTNLAIAQLLLPYRQEEDTDAKAKDRNAGRMIGTLERLIILIFIALQQYAAIGLVLTAKSIARYDKITKEPAFSEYYLLGTLLSTLAAIIVSRMI